MTDSDDVAAARARGDTVEMLFPGLASEGTLLIPNTVAQVAGAPHPEEARRLIDYLLSPEVELALARAPGAQIPLRAGLPWPDALPPRATLRVMEVDFERVADHLPEAVSFCREVFVR
jgi:iron(III) transport system substrate-binding protein